MKNMAGRMIYLLNEIRTRPEIAEPVEVQHLCELASPCARAEENFANKGKHLAISGNRCIGPHRWVMENSEVEYCSRNWRAFQSESYVNTTMTAHFGGCICDDYYCFFRSCYSVHAGP